MMRRRHRCWRRLAFLWARRNWAWSSPRDAVVSSSGVSSGGKDSKLPCQGVLYPAPVDFDLSEELAALRDSVRRLAQDKVKPRARAIDREGTYPQDIFEAFRDAGLLGLCIPVEYGGSGAGILGLAVAIEEVAKYSNAAAPMLLLTRLATGPVMIAGTEEQKQRYLPGICDGTLRAAFGLSEPQAGSDVMGMRTRGVPDEGSAGDWVLNGTKCWMSGVREA